MFSSNKSPELSTDNVVTALSVRCSGVLWGTRDCDESHPYTHGREDDVFALLTIFRSGMVRVSCPRINQENAVCNAMINHTYFSPEKGLPTCPYFKEKDG